MSNRSPEKLQHMKETYGVSLAADNQHVVEEAQYLIFAVKPQQFPTVCAQLQRKPEPWQTVVSIMAGVTLETLTEQLGNVAIFRAMPNTPAKIGWGMTGVAANAVASEEQKQVVLDIFHSVGQTIFIEEAYIDAVGAVSGSGPCLYVSNSGGVGRRCGDGRITTGDGLSVGWSDHGRFCHDDAGNRSASRRAEGCGNQSRRHHHPRIKGAGRKRVCAALSWKRYSRRIFVQKELGEKK